jgi:hypothetical protein
LKNKIYQETYLLSTDFLRNCLTYKKNSPKKTISIFSKTG